MILHYLGNSSRQGQFGNRLARRGGADMIDPPQVANRLDDWQNKTNPQEAAVANKDKGGKTDKKQPQKNLKEKRAAKKQKKK
jgi:hypothetical protein